MAKRVTRTVRGTGAKRPYLMCEICESCFREAIPVHRGITGQICHGSPIDRADLRKRWRFFVAHAGFSTPPGRAACALALARAEIWAEREGLQFAERMDTEQAFCYCDNPACKYHEGSTYEWDTIGIVCYRRCDKDHDYGDCTHHEILGSLWGIMDADDDYKRVVRAELAYEAMG